jgi:hypothetical protein
MHRHSRKPRAAPPGPACPAPHPAPERLELRLRPSGRWAVFDDGRYVCSTGTCDRRLAGIRLRMVARQIEARQAP